jgi:hypothetical protein
MNSHKLTLALQAATVVLLTLILWRQSGGTDLPSALRATPATTAPGVAMPNAAALSEKLDALTAAITRLEKIKTAKDPAQGLQQNHIPTAPTEKQQQQFDHAMEFAQSSISGGVLTRQAGELLLAELGKLTEAQREEVFLMIVRSINSGTLKPEPGSGF